jgi:hypothetical protein
MQGPNYLSVRRNAVHEDKRPRKGTHSLGFKEEVGKLEGPTLNSSTLPSQGLGLSAG